MSDFRFCFRIVSLTFPRVWLGWKLLETRNDETIQKNRFTWNKIDLSDFDFISIPVVWSWNPSEPLDSSNTFRDSFALTARTNEPRRGHDMLLDHFEFMDRSPQVLSGDHHAEVQWSDSLMPSYDVIFRKEREREIDNHNFCLTYDLWFHSKAQSVTTDNWKWCMKLCPEFADWFQAWKKPDLWFENIDHVIVHENETCQVDGDVEFRDVEFLEIEIPSWMTQCKRMFPRHSKV